MCRMFAVRGSHEFASSLQKALISAAESDDFRNPIGSHDNGWGGVWYSIGEQKYYRSVTPIFKDKIASNFFNGDSRESHDSLMGLSHARLAAKGEPIRGPFDSHPFSTHIGEELVYVTHNGHINKFKIRDEAGVRDPSTMNDTEVFTFLMERMKGSSSLRRLEEAIKLARDVGALEGALNLMVLSVNRNGEKNIYYHCEFPNIGRELYYSLYFLRQDTENLAVMSSTIAFKTGLISYKGEPLIHKVSMCPRSRTLVLSS